MIMRPGGLVYHSVNGKKMIEPISKLDVDSVFKLMKLNMGAYYVQRNEEWDEDEIRQHFLKQNGIVVRKEDELAGFSFYELKEARIHIHTLQINPKYQNKMLGGRFFNWYKKLAQEVKADVITCGVYESNPARYMYERIGFIEIGNVNGVVRMSLPLTSTGSGRKSLAPLL